MLTEFLMTYNSCKNLNIFKVFFYLSYLEQSTLSFSSLMPNFKMTFKYFFNMLTS